MNVINQNPYLRTSREFPEEVYLLSLEVNRAYIDTATAVNNRTIGLFPTNRSANTGEAWFINKAQKQQGFRQVYTFNSSADIQIGFKIENISRITKSWGSYTDGTNYYGVPYASNVAIAGQLSYYIFSTGVGTSSDVIRFLVGAGSPAITEGTIVLEWISEK